MEFLEDSSKNTNNNIIDDLDVLKDQQNTSEQLKIADQINKLVEDQHNSNDLKLTDLTEEIKTEVTNDQSNLIKELNEDNKVNDLVNELINKAENNQSDQTDDVQKDDIQKDDIQKDDIQKDDIQKDDKKEEIQKDNLINDQTDKPSELTESTKQLLVDLNDTENLLDSPNVLNSSNVLDSSTVLNSSNLENLTAENFLEHSIPSNHQAEIIDLLDCSVNEEISNKNCVLDCSMDEELCNKHSALNSTQETSLEDSNKENVINTTQESLDKTEENLLDQMGLNDQNSNLMNESIQEIDLANESANSLVNATGDLNQSKEESEIKCSQQDQVQQNTLLEQLCNEPQKSTTDNQNLLTSLVNDELKDEPKDEIGGELFHELNEKLNKKVDEFINTLEPTENITQVQQTLEDFVINDESKANKTEEIKIDEAKLDEKSSDNKESTSEPIENETILSNEPSNKESPKKTVTEEVLNIEHQETNKDNDDSEIATIIPTSNPETSKIEDVLNESQEILKQADELIASKKNSIPNEINIPGLDISGSKQSDVEKPAESEIKDQVASIEPTNETESPGIKTDESATEEDTNKSTKQSSSRKCEIF